MCCAPQCASAAAGLGVLRRMGIINQAAFNSGCTRDTTSVARNSGFIWQAHQAAAHVRQFLPEWRQQHRRSLRSTKLQADALLGMIVCHTGNAIRPLLQPVIPHRCVTTVTVLARHPTHPKWSIPSPVRAEHRSAKQIVQFCSWHPINRTGPAPSVGSTVTNMSQISCAEQQGSLEHCELLPSSSGGWSMHAV
jgi:hypothetical protein